MIVKEYYQNINTRAPRNYFEKWYSDVWARRIGSATAPPGSLFPILENEISEYGATIASTDREYKFRVSFEDDRNYTLFMLKWS